MKRTAILLAILTCTVLQLLAQPMENGDRSHRLLSPAELRNEPWFYSIDEAMKHPGSVYKLSLSDQKIKELPDAVFKLSNLQMLNLSNCGLKYLNPEIRQCKKLQMITLYGNSLKYLPIEIRELSKLEVLYLGRNKLTAIPVWMGGLGKLRRLDVSQNRISPQELFYINRMMPGVDVTH